MLYVCLQLTKSWAQGSTVLIGDACHPMMPNLGQGGCQAMEDGYMLTNMLKEVRDISSWGLVYMIMECRILTC